MAWILNLTCSGPGELSSDQNVSLEWFIYILFSSCSQQLLLTALHVCFLLVVSITATVTRLKRKLQTSISTTPSSSKHYRTRSISLLYISTLTLLSIYALLALALCAWHVYSSCTTSWTSSSIAQVVFSACQALACTAFPLIVAHHLAYNPTLHPTSIRLWWFLTSILSIFQFCSAVIRLASYGLSYSSFLIADDFFSIVSFPISLFLLVVSVNGSSGLSTSSTDPSTEPLLNGSQSDQNNKKQELPITLYYTASLFSKSMWLWLNPLLSKGYKTTLQIEDVPELAPDDRAERLYDLLQSNWPKFKTDHPVRSALLRSFRGSLSFTAVLAFTKAVSSYAGPVMIQSFVDFLDTDTRYYIEGYALVFILLVAKAIEVLSTHHYQFLSQKLGMTIRSCLITTIYRKGLRLSTSSRQSHGAGRIVNYMTIDVQQINDSIVQVHNIWVLPLQVVLALLILYREIGLSMLAGFVTMIILTGFISYNSRLLRKFSMEVMMKKDARMRATTEVLNYMKIIKLQAWEEYFRKRVEDYRLTEYGSIKWFQLALTSNITVLSVSTSIVCIITFGTCLLLNVSLTSAKVFTVISTFNILAEPIRTFPQAIIAVSQALVSVDRLDKFMLSKELGDYVVRGPPSKSEFSVSVEGGNFTWDEDKATPMLHDINVKVPHGYLVAIVGTVGGGKSSLLAAMLGEMPKLSGTVQVNGTTAYVPQTAWIQSGTVEENILFGMPMDRARYRRTIKSCCLEQDLELLEFGDQTEIGERGINLSGGQKQRVQLARAVYQSSDIYYLDDIFSAVDAHTGSAIFKDCLLGILHNKTRILVTHQVEFLHKADLILVVQDGAIQQSGKYSELVKAGAEFGALIAAHKKSLGSVEVDDAGVGSLNDEWNESFGESGKLLVRSGSGSLSNSQENLLKQRSSSSFASSAGDVAGKLVEEEKRETGRVGWNVYWLFLTNAYGPFFFLIVMIIQAIAQGFSIGSDFWLSYETSESSFSAAEFMRVYSLLCLGNWVFTAIRGVLMCMFSLKTSQTFYLGMLKCIFRAPMSFFDTTPTGRILTRASTDQATLDILLPLSFVLAMMLYASTLGVVVVACVITWPIVFAVLPLAWVYFRYQAFYINSSREITRLDSVTKAPVIHHFTETIAGFLVIRGFGKEEEFAITNVNRVNTNLKMDFHFNASNDWLGFRLEIIGAVVLCVAAFLLIVLPSSVITPASAALSLSYGFSLNSVLAASVFFSCTIENKMVAVERIGQFTRLPSEAPLVIESSVPHKDWPQWGNISIRDLLVRYQPTMPLVLKGISLDIIGGQKIGVVGRTGSGKSTLIQVLFRIVEPAGGVIKFDEVDITSVGLHDLRSKLGIIPQDPVLFEGTIRTNMDPLGVHTEAEIWEGIRKCQLADVVEARDEKLDAVVEDNGENFSVGQRQLLCLGRALLKKSHILFLDEATASVDAQTDAVLQRIIREEFQSCTVVSIAHRIPTVMDCDKVMVLEAGLLKEYDSPARLLEHPSTLFAALVREYTTRSEG